MLKVVGASWLQTRISTYILVAVALLGIGAIILSEFGRAENDGTYAATVSWTHEGGYRIEFWGQGNDLAAIPPGAARAYYKTGILNTGWSYIEIETSEDFTDMVQAYSAGLLEGSLSWQLIHHHWHNTVRAACPPRFESCKKMRQYLRENNAFVRERAELLAPEDPYWHMVRLYYAQLDGLEDGWRFAVRRSRQSVEIEPEDFLWLAMASDLPELERAVNGSNSNISSMGMTFLKSLTGENQELLMALAHNTAAPYAKMLRLLKRYSFAYHQSPNEGSEPVAGRSIVMSSYPGALSSQDEYYIVNGEQGELMVAGTPLAVNNRSLSNRLNAKEQVMLGPRVMAANRLASDGRSWSRLLARHNSGTANRQWLTIKPKLRTVWLIEQLPGLTHAADQSKEFSDTGYLSCTGTPIFQEVKEAIGPENVFANFKNIEISRIQVNVTTLEHVTNLMRGYGYEEDSYKNVNSNTYANSDPAKIFALRNDLAGDSKPLGVIDTKVLLATSNGLENFKAYSGPTFSDVVPAFNWSKSFPNTSHVGHPETFNFDSVSPEWAWD